MDVALDESDPRVAMLRRQAGAVLASRHDVQTTDLDGTPLPPHKVVCHAGPRTAADFAAEDALVASGARDEAAAHFDRRHEGAREKLIFQAETGLWQDAMDECNARAGVGRRRECALVARVYQERRRYEDSRFNAALRPTLTPGLPPAFERVVLSADDAEQ